MLDPNERCAFPLLTSGCSQRQWCRSCSDEALKVGNSVIDDCVLIMQKPFLFFRVFIFQNILEGSYQMFKIFPLILKTKTTIAKLV